MPAACQLLPRRSVPSMYLLLLLSRRPAGCDLRVPSFLCVVPRLRTLPHHVDLSCRTLTRDPAGFDLRVPGHPSLRLERLHE
jgi:hypothetical protein